MAEASVARLMLAAARRDEQAFRALAALPAMNDAAIGFHAHQWAATRMVDSTVAWAEGLLSKPSP